MDSEFLSLTTRGLGRVGGACFFSSSRVFSLLIVDIVADPRGEPKRELPTEIRGMSSKKEAEWTPETRRQFDLMTKGTRADARKESPDGQVTTRKTTDVTKEDTSLEKQMKVPRCRRVKPIAIVPS